MHLRSCGLLISFPVPNSQFVSPKPPCQNQGILPDTMHLLYLAIVPDVLTSLLSDLTDGTRREDALSALWENYRSWCEDQGHLYYFIRPVLGFFGVTSVLIVSGDSGYSDYCFYTMGFRQSVLKWYTRYW